MLTKAISKLYRYEGRELILAGKLFQRHGCSERITDLMRSAGPQLAAVLLRDNDLLCESGLGVEVYTRLKAPAI